MPRQKQQKGITAQKKRPSKREKQANRTEEPPSDEELTLAGFKVVWKPKDFSSLLFTKALLCLDNDHELNLSAKEEKAIKQFLTNHLEEQQDAYLEVIADIKALEISYAVLHNLLSMARDLPDPIATETTKTTSNVTTPLIESTKEKEKQQKNLERDKESKDVVTQKQSLLTSPPSKLPPLIQPSKPIQAPKETLPSMVLGSTPPPASKLLRTPVPPLHTPPISPPKASTSSPSTMRSTLRPVLSSPCNTTSTSQTSATEQKKRSIVESGLSSTDMEPEAKRARLLQLNSQMIKLKNNSSDPVLIGMALLSLQMVTIGELLQGKNIQEDVDTQLKEDLQDSSSELFEKLMLSLQDDPYFSKETRISFVRGYVRKTLKFSIGTQLNKVATIVLLKLLCEWRSGPRDFWLVRRLRTADMQEYHLSDAEKLIADANYVQDKALNMYIALRALSPKRSGTRNLWSFFPEKPTKALLKYIMTQICPEENLQAQSIKQEAEDEENIEFDSFSSTNPEPKQKKEGNGDILMSGESIQDDAVAHALLAEGKKPNTANSEEYDGFLNGF